MTTNGIIRWVQEPPASTHFNHSGVRARFVDELKSRPGRWAQYRPGHGHNSSVAYGFNRDYPGVEAVTRSRGGGKRARFDCYVRWVGP